MKRANVNNQAARVVALVVAKVVAKGVGGAQAGMAWADVVRNSPVPTVAATLVAGLMPQSYFGSSLHRNFLGVIQVVSIIIPGTAPKVGRNASVVPPSPLKAKPVPYPQFRLVYPPP